jgi:formyltetrahydrofolate deformylase
MAADTDTGTRPQTAGLGGLQSSTEPSQTTTSPGPVGKRSRGSSLKIASPPSIIAMLVGPDQPGLVARVAGWIFDSGGNILHADQHRDAEENIFFQRVEWTQPGDITELRRAAVAFVAMAREKLGMNARMALSHDLPRLAVLASKIPHCLQDIAWRWKRGELHGNLICAVSDDPDLQAFCQSISLPFRCVERRRRSKEEAEDIQLKIFHRYGIDMIVMAGYTQVLSSDFLQSIRVPVINIHHSFLPAFSGGRPYQEAYARGVKLIGATAYYATLDPDKGPIIAQDVMRISHRDTVEDLIAKGRDLEMMVLAQAVRWHLENRVLVYNNKTVVFD